MAVVVVVISVAAGLWFVGCVISCGLILFTLQDLNFRSPSFCHVVDLLCSKTAILFFSKKNLP